MVEKKENKSTGVAISKFPKKNDLSNLKLNADELDIDKLKIVATVLSKLNNAVDNDVVKKLYMLNWLNKLIRLFQTKKNI